MALVALYAARDRQISRISKVATFTSKTIATTLEADRILSGENKHVVAHLRENAWAAFADVRTKTLAEQTIFESSSLNRDSSEYMASAADAFANIEERDALLRNLASSRDLVSAAKRDLASTTTGPVAENAANLLRAAQLDETRQLRGIATATEKLRSALEVIEVKGTALAHKMGDIEFPHDELRAAIDRYGARSDN